MTRDRRREFLDELKATIPVYAMTEDIAESVARVGAELASRGTKIVLADLIIGATALGLGYAVATGNARDFRRIPELQVVEI